METEICDDKSLGSLDFMKQTNFSSIVCVGKPRKTDTKSFGLVKSSVELMDCLTKKKSTVEIEVEMHYFENSKYDHCASLRTDDKSLLFGSLTQVHGGRMF